MSERKVYALCDANCRYETLTKEEIYAAIMQAVNTGSIGNCDTGFITTIKTIGGTPLKFFVGTQYEYNNLSEADKENLFAIITDDVDKEALFTAIENLDRTVTEVSEGVRNGAIVASKAQHDAEGNEITKTYIKNMGGYVEGIAGTYKLPAAGTYHIQMVRVAGTNNFMNYTVDFGLIRWKASDFVHTSADACGGDGKHYGRYYLEIGSNGLVRVFHETVSTGTISECNTNKIYVKQIF